MLKELNINVEEREKMIYVLKFEIICNSLHKNQCFTVFVIGHKG